MPLRRALAVVLGLWVLMPGNLSAAYWLGLAFQAPSALGALAAAAVGWTALRPLAARTANSTQTPLRWEAGLVLFGLLLGWALLLDTFAQLPSALYPLGFGQPALLVLTVLAVLPLLQAGAVRRASAWLAPAALALYVFAAPSHRQCVRCGLGPLALGVPARAGVTLAVSPLGNQALTLRVAASG